MKVIAIGFSKTGTKSMHMALKKLGYRVYDYEQNNFYLRKEWLKIMSRQGGTKEDFFNMYKDVDATMDIPACMFWMEILEAFPDAKLIFSERHSEEDWWISWDNMAQKVAKNKLMTALVWLSPTAYSSRQYSRHVGRVALATHAQRFWHSYQGASPTVAKIRYRNHNANIREYRKNAPKDQFLTFNPSEGWEPLCKFLGKPIPDEDFPHRNKGGTVVDDWLRESPHYRKMKQEAVIVLTTLIVFAAVAIVKLLY